MQNCYYANLVRQIIKSMRQKRLKRPNIDWSDLAEAMKSMAHPERLAILHLMCNCGDDQIIVKNIYETLHLEQSITSRHLGLMRKSKLLKREVREGKVFYGFDRDSLTAQCVKNLLTE